MSNAPDQVALQGTRRWIALFFLALGVSMSILDATVVWSPRATNPPRKARKELLRPETPLSLIT